MNAVPLRVLASIPIAAIGVTWVFLGDELAASHVLSAWARGEAFGFAALGAITLISLVLVWRKPRAWQPLCVLALAACFAVTLLALRFQFSAMLAWQFASVFAAAALLHFLVRSAG
jgi:hypothetical protein